jgi:hypothetical protein
MEITLFKYHNFLLLQAARSFLKAELLVQRLKNPSYEELLASAMAVFQQAAKLQEEAGGFLGN